jgi:hypothetical protein
VTVKASSLAVVNSTGPALIVEVYSGFHYGKWRDAFRFFGCNRWNPRCEGFIRRKQPCGLCIEAGPMEPSKALMKRTAAQET